MSKLVKLALVATCFTLSTQAIADNGFYLSGKTGMSFISVNDQNYRDDDLFDNHVETFDWGSKTKSSFNLGVQAGYDFYPTYQLPIRLELDYTFRPETKFSQSTDPYFDGQRISDDKTSVKSKVTLHTTMLNAYYDFHNSSDFTPYIGVGIGLGMIDSKYTFIYDLEEDDEYGKLSKSKTNFSWSVNAGVSYKINENLAADFGYRYLDAGKIEIKGTTLGIGEEKFSTKFTSHDVTVGLRYSF